MTHPVLLALATSLALACGSVAVQAAPKVLRYAFPIAETGFDPAQISDLYSRTVAANIFETPLTFDYLARPASCRASSRSCGARRCRRSM
jgi:ABC-type oligopeptide transport system substrate-binding subunit